ncbi:MAG: hypothetical protein J2P53_00250 [Bradyrhizobiaceae bacterium]|nr:hypothetical protein [Bradyrhizobiaceae bacterium]
MVDLQAVQIELQNARRARINAQLACCDIEDLTDEIQRTRRAVMPGWAATRRRATHPVLKRGL